MKGLLLFLIHLAAVLARFLKPGGLRGRVAENPLIEQQLLILGRTRQRAPKLSSADSQIPQHGSRPIVPVSRLGSQLRELEIEPIKTVPHVPVSHPFVERLIGTVCREFLDQTFLPLHRSAPNCGCSCARAGP